MASVTNLLNKYLQIIHLNRVQFAKYFSIGTFGVFLDISSLYFLKEFLGIRPLWGVVINQIFLINYVFFANKFWSFDAKGMGRQQFVRFCSLFVFNYGFSIFWMWLVNEQLHLNYLLSRMINIALAVSWNFVLYKYWVFAVNLKTS